MRKKLVLMRFWALNHAGRVEATGKIVPPGLAIENLSDKAQQALRWAL
jgi:hypothetical protein